MKRPVNALPLIYACLLVGCVGAPGQFTDPQDDAELVQGPPIRDIVTEFDQALQCLDGKFPERLNFGVGAIADSTGKEQYADGGNGKLVTQGAGDIVQSALFTAGVGVVNRRDPNIALAENNWGIRDIKTVEPVDFYVTGSVTSLDFIPGGALEVSVAGVGPKARQNRIVVGLDLAMTDAASGRIVANVPVQKQLYETENGFGIGRFVDKTLLEVDAGGMQREALQFTLRQMLSYASFELLAQLLDPATAAPCRALIGPEDASSSTAAPRHAAGALSDALEAHDLHAEAMSAQAAPPPPQGQPAPAVPQPGPAPAASAQQGAPADATAAEPNPPEALQLAAEVTVLASRSIAAAESAAKAATPEERKKFVDEAGLNLVLAVKKLKAAAAAGLHGPEGDAAALLVEQAMKLEESARKSLEAGDSAASPALPAPNDPKQIPGATAPP